jgi:DNA-binding XRE family transcriptional regulator
MTMATVSLYDPRDPMVAGHEILNDVLAGREVAADREALMHALYDAAEVLGDTWYHLADRAGDHSPNAGRLREIDEAYREAHAAVTAAEAIFAALRGTAMPCDHRLQLLRNCARMTRAELAERSGIDPIAIEGYENGREIPPERAAQLAEFFDVSIGFLMGEPPAGEGDA